METRLKSKADFILSDKLRRQAKFQINSAKHMATEFIMSNKLRYDKLRRYRVKVVRLLKEDVPCHDILMDCELFLFCRWKS